ncbi:MAG: ribose-phosphate diphosphokinase [Desulfurococcales archaeon]|nr:ribose-phosphate diphosphokinase [Desulfurococcales archaeon]
MADIIVLGGSAGEHIAIKLAEILGVELGFIEVKKFPDGETYIRVHSDISGKRVIYVNSLQRGPNELIIETLYTLDTLKDLGASEIHAVIPYMAYARQDERFNPGEVVSILSLAKLFKALDLDGIYTIDMHLHRITKPEKVFGSKFYNLTGVRELAKYVKKHHSIENTVVIGPDEEAEQWAKTMAEELGGLEYSILEKKRLTAEEVVIEAKGVDVRDKNVVIVDDIISTGGTIVESIKALRKLGAKDIIVTTVHPILVGRALPKLLRLGLKDLVGTDTVLSPISKVSIAPAIAIVLKKRLGL